MNTEMSLINDNIRLAATEFHIYGCKGIAELIGMPLQTFYDRMSNPSKWRIDELLRVCKRCNVTLGWLMEKHSIVA